LRNEDSEGDSREELVDENRKRLAITRANMKAADAWPSTPRMHRLSDQRKTHQGGINT